MLEPLDLNQLAQKIKQWGLELGFQQVGITDTDLSESESELQVWLDKQYYGEMDWMARRGMLRARPHELSPGTLCVISVRMNYPPANAASASTLKNPKLGYVSRYTLGRDYHRFPRNRLKKLDEMTQQHCVSLNFRPSVDSAPVLERPLVEKAGLGWAGKHSLILNREVGSFFFLDGLLVDIPLPVDQPVEEGCGKCVVCMTIYSTGAIAEPYTADARCCISHPTIELEGAIPEELRPLMGNRIYGCDDCQLICPWNRYPQLTTEEDFSPCKPLHAPEPTELSAWSEEKSLKVMEGSAIRRIGYLRWPRNIAVALGNAPQDETTLTALEGRKSEHLLFDEHIVWAIAQQIERRNACIVEVQLPKKQRLVRMIEKGLPRDA